MGPVEIAGWVAPAATMIAAIMTASNLGARITGWGFVVFAVGSIAWTVVAIGTSQLNLLWTNGFLIAVNVLGIWRWLGRQARYEDGSQSASEKSASLPAPTLIPASSLTGRKLVDRRGETLGTVVEAMVRCDDARIGYLVISEGGVGGVGERLHAIDAGAVRFDQEAITGALTASQLAASPVLEAGQWPADLREARAST
ncbi:MULTISPECIES: PRC-barrel domain-containing protein [unclassified Phenylobacterium]|jgi:sporulation protein YlmC with PRC-barrel domain|uniref:PRC-barrel domain-containing protein n=1 Tax=unclassified Phenylobacterium TaxID=2640670 RepID=UPI001910E7FD|nr:MULTISPECIES: PRC-barrel domain-containing protein [unclassified Phenylobacterium]